MVKVKIYWKLGPKFYPIGLPRRWGLVALLNHLSLYLASLSVGLSVNWGGGPTWRNTEIDLFFQQNSEKLYIFWRILENRYIVGHGNLEFWRTEYGKSFYPTDTDIA